MSSQTENSPRYTTREKRVLYAAIFRAAIMGVALVAIIWTIAKLNSGTVFNGGNTTATLLGITADRGH